MPITADFIFGQIKESLENEDSRHNNFDFVQWSLLNNACSTDSPRYIAANS